MPEHTPAVTPIAEWLEGHRLPSAPVRRDAIIGLDWVLEAVESTAWRLLNDPECGRGLLFSGPPGTGKTLVARYLASHLSETSGDEVPFYVLPADELTPIRIRELFAELDSRAVPSLVYIDEVDDLLRDSDGPRPPTPEIRAQAMALLAALDGTRVTARRAVLVVSTNLSSWGLNPAMTRSGRLGAPLLFNPPATPATIEALYRLYLRDYPLSADVDLGSVAQISGQVTGADIRDMVAMMRARMTRDGRSEINYDDIYTALASRNPTLADAKIDPKDTPERTLFHEAAHAVVAASLLGSDSVLGILLYRQDCAAVTMNHDEEQETGELQRLRQIAVGLAGRLAEELRYGDATMGSHSDMESTEKLFRAILANGRWSHLARLAEAHQPFPSATSERQELADLRRDCHSWAEAAATAALRANWGLVGSIAEALRGRKAMDGDTFRRLVFESGAFVLPDLPELPARLAPRQALSA